MMIKTRYRPYEEKFILFSDYVEKTIKKIFILVLILLIGIQFLLSFESFRKEFIPVEKMEGSASKFHHTIDYIGRI